eukprot:1364511-Amorphochlora_amoeboformis.AAC.1
MRRHPYYLSLQDGDGRTPNGERERGGSEKGLREKRGVSEEVGEGERERAPHRERGKERNHHTHTQREREREERERE